MKLLILAAAAAAVSAAVLASGAAASGSVFLCTPANGDAPYVLDAALVPAAIQGGSRYATAVFGQTGLQMNNTATARMTCLPPSEARPRLSATGGALVSDNNGQLYPAALADNATIGYPAVTVVF